MVRLGPGKVHNSGYFYGSAISIPVGSTAITVGVITTIDNAGGPNHDLFRGDCTGRFLNCNGISTSVLLERQLLWSVIPVLNQFYGVVEVACFPTTLLGVELGY